MGHAGFDGSSLPKVVASSVIRSTSQGESHGGMYVIDLQTRSYEQVVDWDDDTISWEGRGMDRGLRGIAIYHDNVYLAASDEIFVYTKDFQLVESHRNPYLKHCHEICIGNDTLFVASTGYDSVLEFDLPSRSFTRGYCFRHSVLHRFALRVARRLLRRTHMPKPNVQMFDPNTDGGPVPGDTLHINNVHSCDGVLYLAGIRLDALLSVNRNEVLNYSRIPYGSHNARPFREGSLLNDTRADQVAYVGLGGNIIEAFAIPRYNQDDLSMSHLPRDHARQAFGRGLCVTSDGLVIGGSSPATVSVYRFGDPTPLRTVNITMDVRNSIHGLELWPY